MKKVKTNTQVIVGPIIAILGLICGSAFANEKVITSAQRIQIDARQELALSLAESMKDLRDKVSKKIHNSHSIKSKVQH